MSRQSRKLFILLIAFLFAAGALPAAVPVEAGLKITPELDERLPGLHGAVNATALDDDYVYLGGTFGELFYDTMTMKDIALLDTETGAVDKSVHISDTNEVYIYEAVSDGNGGWYVAGSIDTSSYPMEGLAHILPDGTRDPDWNPRYQRNCSQMVVGGGYLYVTGYQKMQRFNLKTGQLDTSWEVPLTDYYDPNDIALSSDGKSIFLLKSSSDVHGLRKLDIASASLVDGWAPAFTLTGDTNNITPMAMADGKIYFSGAFAAVDGQARDGLAAVYEDSGELVEDWNPSTGENIDAIAADARGHVYVGYTNYSNYIGSHYLKRFHTTDGSVDNWTPVFNQAIRNMKVQDDALYILGPCYGDPLVDGQRLKRFNLDNGSQTAVWNLVVKSNNSTFAVDHQKILTDGHGVKQQVRNLIRLNRANRKV